MSNIDKRALRDSAESTIGILENIAGFEPSDIDGDIVELRFETEDGLLISARKRLMWSVRCWMSWKPRTNIFLSLNQPSNQQMTAMKTARQHNGLMIRRVWHLRNTARELKPQRSGLLSKGKPCLQHVVT